MDNSTSSTGGLTQSRPLKEAPSTETRRNTSAVRGLSGLRPLTADAVILAATGEYALWCVMAISEEECATRTGNKGDLLHPSAQAVASDCCALSLALIWVFSVTDSQGV